MVADNPSAHDFELPPQTLADNEHDQPNLLCVLTLLIARVPSGNTANVVRRLPALYSVSLTLACRHVEEATLKEGAAGQPSQQRLGPTLIGQS